MKEVLIGSVFDPNTSNTVRVSRIGMALVLGMILAIHGMILAI